MTNTFLTADLHFFHGSIIEFESRPFNNVENMNSALIKNWNRVVSDEDRVFILGDFSFSGKENTTNIVRQLKGRKILILGNHDRVHSTSWWLETGIGEVIKYPVILDEFIVLMHEPPSYYNSACPYFYIHGHVHGTEMYPTITKQSACVCVERWDYSPVNIKTLFDAVEKLKAGD